jgi:hypothetical protein
VAIVRRRLPLEVRAVFLGPRGLLLKVSADSREQSPPYCPSSWAFGACREVPRESGPLLRDS